MSKPDVCFIYSLNGKPSGFNATRNDYWVQKVDSTPKTDISTMFPLQNLKLNLRRLIKDKKAYIVRAGKTEAVAVKYDMLDELFR